MSVSTKLAPFRVRSADNMSLEDFEMHMNVRHKDSLGAGQEHLTLSSTTPYIVQCYRVFHRTLHRLRRDIEHEHGQYRPERNADEQQEDRRAS